MLEGCDVAVPVLSNSLSVVVDSTIVLSTKLGLLYLDLRQVGLFLCPDA